MPQDAALLLRLTASFLLPQFKKEKKRKQEYFILSLTCLVCCVMPCVSLQEETERGCRGALMMVLCVTHMHALCATRPPVTLSPMTTFIMYSGGIIPPFLPPSLTHVHHHPSHQESGMDGEGLRDRGDARQMTK